MSEAAETQNPSASAGFVGAEQKESVTVSDAQMEKDISDAEKYKPYSEECVESIREAIIRARATEVPEGTKFVDDEKENDKWVNERKEWNEKVRKEVAEMTDEEVLAWAKAANSAFGNFVTVQKKDFETYKGVSPDSIAPNQTEDQKFLERMRRMTPDQQRRRFMRITNPKRKRGDPISKEPKAFQRMLRQCKFIREKMDFDHMSKLELRTRLIQTIAMASINTSDLMERHENQMNLMRESYNELCETLEKTRAELKDSVVHKIPDK